MSITQSSIYKRIFALAIPVSIGQAGNILTNIADTMMLGNYDSDHMVAAATGFQIFIMPFVFLIGVTIALTAFIAKNLGEGKTPVVLGSAMVTYLVVGVFIALVLIGLTYKMEWFHPEIKIQELSIPYLRWMAFSIIPIAVFLTLKQYFEGFELSLLTTIVGLLANGINVLLNYLFIFGNGGFSASGVEGAGLATFLSRVIAVPLFILSIYLVKNYREKISVEQFSFSWAKIKKLLLLGIPMGFQIFIEVVSFAMAGIMTGWISLDAQGAHQVALQLASLTFLIAGGFGTAATVLSGQFYGEKDWDGLKELIRKVIFLIIVYEILTALLFWIFSETLPHSFLKEENAKMILIAVGLINLAAIFQIPDGIQNSLQGILRGLQDVKWPTYIGVACHWFITLLGGYLMAFHTSLGVNGIWYAFILGLSVLALALFLRLKQVLKLIKNDFY